MKNYIKNPLRYCRIFGMLLLVMTQLTAFAQKKKSSRLDPEYRIEVSLESFYDDNILKYSDKYLDRFINHEDPGRFHIDTYDDVILSPELSLEGSFKFFGKHETVFDANASYSQYLKNDIKTWSSFGVGVRQYFAHRLSVKASYTYIPEFYVRHFRDDDWTDVYGYTEETFTPYVFAKDDYSVWMQKTIFKDTRFRLYYYYSKYYHNKHYTEYDSKNNLYRVKLFQPIIEELTLELTYQYITSDAKGYDEPGESKETSDDGDASYVEDGFIFGLTWKMPRILKRYHSLEFETVIYNRYYQTDKPVDVDKLHAGRVDNNLRFYVTYYLSVSRSFKFRAFYNYYYRDSGTTSEYNEEYVSDEKDYVQNRVGIELIYRFDF